MPLRIYLVEDNPLICDALAQSLEVFTQAKVVGSAAGELEACCWLIGHPDSWDLAVVDVRLAEGNGIDVIKCLKGRAGTQKLVVFTLYATEQVCELCLSAGADAFFDKLTQSEELNRFVGLAPMN
jgi:two-component system, OmpR family, response regulator